MWILNDISIKSILVLPISDLFIFKLIHFKLFYIVSFEFGARVELTENRKQKKFLQRYGHYYYNINDHKPSLIALLKKLKKKLRNQTQKLPKT